LPKEGLLERHKVIPTDFAERFIEAVSFRNILVHMYEEVDIRELHHCLQSNLDDFNDFARYIARYIEKADK